MLPVVCIGHHAHFALHGGELLLRSGLLASDSEKRHGCCWVGGVVVGGDIVGSSLNLRIVGWVRVFDLFELASYGVSGV